MQRGEIRRAKTVRHILSVDVGRKYAICVYDRRENRVLYLMSRDMKHDKGQEMKTLFLDIKEALRECRVTVRIFCTELIFLRGFHATQLLVEMCGVVHLAAQLTDSLFFRIHPAFPKIAATGSGSAKKQEVRKGIVKLVEFAPYSLRRPETVTEDEADAIAIAVATHQLIAGSIDGELL